MQTKIMIIKYFEIQNEINFFLINFLLKNIENIQRQGVYLIVKGLVYAHQSILEKIFVFSLINFCF